MTTRSSVQNRIIEDNMTLIFKNRLRLCLKNDNKVVHQKRHIKHGHEQARNGRKEKKIGGERMDGRPGHELPSPYHHVDVGGRLRPDVEVMVAVIVMIIVAAVVVVVIVKVVVMIVTVIVLVLVMAMVMIVVVDVMVMVVIEVVKVIVMVLLVVVMAMIVIVVVVMVADLRWS